MNDAKYIKELAIFTDGLIKILHDEMAKDQCRQYLIDYIKKIPMPDDNSEGQFIKITNPYTIPTTTPLYNPTPTYIYNTSPTC